jgi:hypothetical protein
MKKEDSLFVIPENLLDKLYELTGAADKYKGILLIHCDEEGRPIIFNSCESQIIEAGLMKSMRSYLESCDNIQTK